VQLRLNQLVIEGAESPINPDTIAKNIGFLKMFPKMDLQPIEVEDTGAWCRELGHIFVIRDGKHRYISYLVAGRTSIPYVYKDPEWSASHPPCSTSAPADSLPSAFPSS
jgi:hypothetical protein